MEGCWQTHKSKLVLILCSTNYRHQNVDIYYSIVSYLPVHASWDSWNRIFLHTYCVIELCLFQVNSSAIFRYSFVLKCINAGVLIYLQAPLIIPIFMVFVSIYFVLGPLITDPTWGYFSAFVIAIIAVITFVPFVTKKMVIPGTGILEIY